MNSNVTPLFLLALSFGLFFTYINPQYARIGELQASQTQYAEALEQVKDMQAIKEELETKYNGFSAEEKAKLETLLPDDVDNVRVALDLDGIAERHGVEIKSFKTDKPTAQDLQSADPSMQKPYGVVEVTFMFATTYDKFMGFMKDMEQSLNITDIQSLAFRPLVGDTYDVTMTITTYWLKK